MADRTSHDEHDKLQVVMGVGLGAGRIFFSRGGLCYLLSLCFSSVVSVSCFGFSIIFFLCCWHSLLENKIAVREYFPLPLEIEINPRKYRLIFGRAALNSLLIFDLSRYARFPFVRIDTCFRAWWSRQFFKPLPLLLSLVEGWDEGYFSFADFLGLLGMRFSCHIYPLLYIFHYNIKGIDFSIENLEISRELLTIKFQIACCEW